MSYALSIIETPTGKWMFVGAVPTVLAYDCSDPEMIKAAQRVGPGIARKIATRKGIRFRERVWDNREAAEQFAAEYGYTVHSAR